MEWLRTAGHATEAELCLGYLARSPLGARAELIGPVGERNIYTLRPRGRIAALAVGESTLLVQIGAILATGNNVVVSKIAAAGLLDGLPEDVAHRIDRATDPLAEPHVTGVLFEGDRDARRDVSRALAARTGAIVSLQTVTDSAHSAGEDYDLHHLVEECVVTTNTAAAGGNASLMAIG